MKIVLMRLEARGDSSEDTGLITELDALHTYVDDDNSQNDTKVGVFSDEEE